MKKYTAPERQDRKEAQARLRELERQVREHLTPLTHSELLEVCRIYAYLGGLRPDWKEPDGPS
jgi:hypothetical protein